jgi:hypothetical protein
MKLKKIDYKDQNSSIKDLMKQIENGFKLQKLSSEEIEKLSEIERLDFVDSIILQPDYQREYRYSISDESLLIESILISIPIPAIFLANDRYDGIQVLNVVDGQHRLTAFYRFLKDKFNLQDLKLLSELNKQNFSKLHIDIKSKLLTSTIQQIIFKEFPGRDIELEIFNRYNKGTKPLTPQEIRNAIYGSRIKQYVNQFCTTLYEEGDIELIKSSKITPQNIITLSVVYNVTEDRFLKKKIHESIFVILSILEHGIQGNHKKSPEYAESYMKEKADLEDSLKSVVKKINEIEDETNHPEKSQLDQLRVQKESQEKAIKENFYYLKERFSIFNDFILILSRKIAYPFSRELYGVSSRNYKFQISIAMILAGIVNKFINEGRKLSTMKEIDQVTNYIEELLLDSYLEDKDYNASSTNVTEMKELINKVNLDNIFNKEII